MKGKLQVCLTVAALAGCGDDGGGAGSTSGLTSPQTTSSTTAAQTVGTGSSQGPTTGDSETSTTTATSGTSTDSGSSESGSSTTMEPEVSFENCIEGVFANGYPGVNYDRHGVEVAAHCLGSDHQDIADVQRVVFLGDSITVGTPPTDVDEYYRNLLAERLATDFGLAFGANKPLWQTPNPLEGQSIEFDSGDFSSCAKWGGRNDDLFAGQQFIDCFPEDMRASTLR